MGYFSSSFEANIVQSNNDRINNADAVYENSELGNYPNMETFVAASHGSPQLSNFSPQNFSPKPQQKQSDFKKQETVVKTENPFNKIIDSNSDCDSVIDAHINNCNFQQFGNHINDTMGSPSGSSEVSEISRPCSVSLYHHESPQIHPTYSPLSYQQNSNHLYGNQPQTAPQGTNFSPFFHKNSQEAHNSQAHLNNNFEYNQQGQW